MFIISLTSFGDRLQKESTIAVESILNNSILPDKIVIVISSFDKDNVPDLYKEHYLIEVIYSDYDIKGHNKYYHTMLKYPNDVIITIDDDVIYPSTFVEDCIKAYNSSPNTVNAGRVHKILYNGDSILPYKLWEWETKESGESFDLFFTGVGGVVYPPNIFNKEDLDISIIEKYKNVDDILLNALCRKYKIKVKRIPVRGRYKDINIIPFKIRLCTTNVAFGNDYHLNKINFYKLLINAKQEDI